MYVSVGPPPSVPHVHGCSSILVILLMETEIPVAFLANWYPLSESGLFIQVEGGGQSVVEEPFLVHTPVTADGKFVQSKTAGWPCIKGLVIILG